MDATRETETTDIEHGATVERTSERELVVTRTVNGPARLAFEAWTRAELLERWWSPESFPISLLSCETDPRVGGRYRLVFGYEGSTFEFFGRYLEVTPHSRLVWTNDEAEEGEQITTVTFAETDGRTLVVVHDLYPSKEALDTAIASGSTSGMSESLAQLDELLGSLGAEPNS
ncbi:MAG TPA: SRPBCC domain-containing protein [Candidatus Binatia bacterium]|nr:SRPBCC domain-containing protein [Candidatus Binatia bacterium]